MASQDKDGWGCLACSEFDKYLKLCAEKLYEATAEGNQRGRRFWRKQRDDTLDVWGKHLEVFHQLPLPMETTNVG